LNFTSAKSGSTPVVSQSISSPIVPVGAMTVTCALRSAAVLWCRGERVVPRLAVARVAGRLQQPARWRVLRRRSDQALVDRDRAIRRSS
jgi:hypothetical protein